MQKTQRCGTSEFRSIKHDAPGPEICIFADFGQDAESHSRGQQTPKTKRCWSCNFKYMKHSAPGPEICVLAVLGQDVGGHLGSIKHHAPRPEIFILGVFEPGIHAPLNLK